MKPAVFATKYRMQQNLNAVIGSAPFFSLLCTRIRDLTGLIKKCDFSCSSCWTCGFRKPPFPCQHFNLLQPRPRSALRLVSPHDRPAPAPSGAPPHWMRPAAPPRSRDGAGLPPSPGWQRRPGRAWSGSRISRVGGEAHAQRAPRSGRWARWRWVSSAAVRAGGRRGPPGSPSPRWRPGPAVAAVVPAPRCTIGAWASSGPRCGLGRGAGRVGKCLCVPASSGRDPPEGSESRSREPRPGRVCPRQLPAPPGAVTVGRCPAAALWQCLGTGPGSTGGRETPRAAAERVGPKGSFLLKPLRGG